MVKNDFQPPDTCPVCGEAVPHGALACPNCGADERTGWDDEATRYDALDLPDEAFDDESNRPSRKRWHESALWVGVALVLVILLIVAVV